MEYRNHRNVQNPMIRAYLSNISPLWPVERQEAMLPPGAQQFRDILDARDRYAHQPDRLEQRAAMLRPTRRKGGEIVVASLAVLDWTAEGLMSCLTLIMQRGATLRVLDVGLTIAPDSGPAVLHQAAQAFAASRKRDAATERGGRGGAVSAAKRAADTKAKAETIRDDWKRDEFRTQDLLERAGVSRNSAILYLGKRSAAQRIHQASLKRAETKKGKNDDRK